MIRGLLLTFLSILSARVLQVCAVGVDDPPNTPPAPELTQVQVRGTAVLLQCQAPQGHGGHLFKLYRVRERMSTVRWETQQPQAVFEVQVSAVEDDHYCCQYDNSAISRYLTVKAAPRSIMPTAPPQLSVTPPASQVLPGKVLDFYCQAPPPSPGQPPLTFLLIRRPWGAESDQEVGRSSDPHFKVGPVRHLEEGNYTCMYQFTLPDGVRNSNPSSPVSIRIPAPLPAPQLSRDDEGVLVCTGSPSYPGAHFSLFHQGTESPAATQHAPKVQYSARFTVSAQPGQVEGVYQCQYSVQLGSNWAHSERSTAIKLSCTAGSPSCSHFPSGYTPPPTAGKMDLALIIGSVSAALLFLLVLIILGVALHKHAKASAEKRRQRQQDAFWQQVHSRDHIIDLTLQRINISSAECVGDEGERVSVSEHIYDCPFSTFNTPLDK